MIIANIAVEDTGLWNLPVEDIQFPGGFGDEVTALRSNIGKPVIVIETTDGYRLLDGWGRISGLINAGAGEAQAILVSEEDLAERTTDGDDEEWNAAMYAKYTDYSYCATTN
jgi:hypothetical protein